MHIVQARVRGPFGGRDKIIAIPEGEDVALGRNDLSAQDPRCSRKQAAIRLSPSGVVTVTALGVNPIFIDTKKDKRMLKKGEKAELSIGDTVFLVADEYPVLLEKAKKAKEDADVESKKKEQERLEKQKEEEEIDRKPLVKPRLEKLPEDAEEKHAAKKAPKRPLADDNTDEEPDLWTVALPGSKKTKAAGGGGAGKKDAMTRNDSALARALAEEEGRGESRGGGVERKAKVTARKTIRPDTEDDYEVYNHSSDEDFTTTPAAGRPSSPKSSVTTRAADNKKPTCKYGANCYRKNPGHRADFYHPPAGDGSD